MSLSVRIKKRLGSFTLDVAFTHDSGGTLGLLGPSGCGKSLTLKCIAGVETPDEGQIILDGATLFDSCAHVNLPPQKRRVGYLFQHYALFPQMTVRQNILCALRGERNRARREALLEESLERFQLKDAADLKPRQLSGGQQQRTALARVLSSRPRLLLLDEPFSALDSHLREKLQLEMREILSAFHRDALLVTHSRDEAYHMCGHTAVMEQGHLSALKETKALFADPGSVCACLMTGCKNIAPARRRGTYQVEVPGWGVVLTAARPVGDGIRAVGIRAHDFSPEAAENRFPVEYLGEMEEPFAWIVSFRFAGQSPDAPPLWRRLPKDGQPLDFPPVLGVEPAGVLLLS